eukprot:gene15725-18684_t
MVSEHNVSLLDLIHYGLLTANTQVRYNYRGVQHTGVVDPSGEIHTTEGTVFINPTHWTRTISGNNCSGWGTVRVTSTNIPLLKLKQDYLIKVNGALKPKRKEDEDSDESVEPLPAAVQPPAVIDKPPKSKHKKKHKKKTSTTSTTTTTSTTNVPLSSDTTSSSWSGNSPNSTSSSSSHGSQSPNVNTNSSGSSTPNTGSSSGFYFQQQQQQQQQSLPNSQVATPNGASSGASYQANNNLIPLPLSLSQQFSGIPHFPYSQTMTIGHQYSPGLDSHSQGAGGVPQYHHSAQFAVNTSPQPPIPSLPFNSTSSTASTSSQSDGSHFSEVNQKVTNYINKWRICTNNNTYMDTCNTIQSTLAFPPIFPRQSHMATVVC